MTEPLIKTYAILLGEKDQSLIDLVEQVRGVDSVYDGTVFQSFMMQGIKLLLDYANAKNVKLYQAYLDLTFNPEQFLATLEDVDTHASLVSSYEQYSTGVVVQGGGEVVKATKKVHEAKKKQVQRTGSIQSKVVSEKSGAGNSSVADEEPAQTIDISNFSSFGM